MRGVRWQSESSSWPSPATARFPLRAALLAAAILVTAGWAFTHRLGSYPFLDDPNEAQYAEVAREMVETGDWMSPQLNYVLFLNKPPLAYWAIAATYKLWGIHEAAARLPGAVAAWGTVVVVLIWAWMALGPFVACLAAAVLASMGGFFVETHAVRPDLWLVLGMTLAHFALWLLHERPSERLHRWSPALALWQLGLAIGLLAKGALGVLIPGLVALVLLARDRRWQDLLSFMHPRAWWLLIAIVGPWHAAMSLTHPGFLWDYFLNQHFLRFFDKKLPRENSPISLPMFWAALAVRLFPWTVFAPLALTFTVARRRDPAGGTLWLLLVTWVLVVVLLFSAASSRLEHYSLPALPPLAIMLASLLAGTERDSAWEKLLWGHWVFLAFVFANGLWVVPRLVREEDWLVPNATFVELALRVFTGLSVSGVIALLLWWRGARRWAATPVAVTFAVLVPLVCDGLVAMAPNNSSFPLSLQLHRELRERPATIVYQAPQEYQTCAGLNYYFRRRIEILPPPGYVLPTYLEPHAARLFIDAATLQRWWREREVLWISDPLAPPQDLSRVLPGPYEVVARDAVRIAVRNLRPQNGGLTEASPSDGSSLTGVFPAANLK